jgi:homoserine kinase
VRRERRAFAPASLSNLACGFDVLGLALAEPGDVVLARRREGRGITIGALTGCGSESLPRDPEENTATVAAAALLRRHGLDSGIELEIAKGVPPGSGLGSSAASAVAAVVAVDALLELGTPTEGLLAAALDGEAVASGARHADNVAPSLLGGAVLVRALEPLDVVSLPFPRRLWLAVVRPHVEVRTREARRVLPESVPLADVVAQSANLGALVVGLFRDDAELLSRALVDRIAEPARASRVPGFPDAKVAALTAGALGASFSGSGPSTFGLCVGEAVARRVAAAMVAAFAAAGLECDSLVTLPGTTGAALR